MTSCILTIIKNEYEYLDEWIKYHLDLGIDHIFIFEDIDSDSHKEITDKYINKVTLNSINIVLNEENKQKVIELKETKKDNPQYIYIKKGLLYIKDNYNYDWCFVIDNDEFITPQNENIKDIISLFNKYDAFIMQWKCYGANGYISKPNYKDKGIIETYTKEITGYIPTATPQSLTKTCYNLNTYQENFFLYTHQPSKYCNFCRTNFERDRNTPIYDKIYIRHYITKSWEEYVWKRTNRGYLYGKIRDFNFFFNVNQDMNLIKNKLIQTINNEILVILPYKQNKSQGKELQLALLLWKKFCTFNYHFIVIGEFNDCLQNEFPWIEFIYLKSKDKIEEQYNQHLDVQYCMEHVINKYKDKYNGFIWMVDDNYAIKPFTIFDILQIHHHSDSFIGDKNASKSYWRYDKYKTRQLLDKENLPHINYTIHYPCYFEIKKIQEIWNKFNMRNESYVLEDIYFNYFKHEEPTLDSEIRLGIWNKKIFEEEFQKAVDNPNIKFMCNSVEGWSKELEKELEKIVN